MEHYAVEWTEWAVHRLFFWETDDAKKGRIIRTLHHSCMYALMTMMIVSHTIYPAFWLQTLVLAICCLIWIQHVLTHGCVVSKVEQKLLKDESSFVDPFLDLFHIDMTNESKSGLVIMGSSLVVFLLGLEWMGRINHKLIGLAKQVPALVASSMPHIPPVSSFRSE